jgi:hypothetical protein
LFLDVKVLVSVCFKYLFLVVMVALCFVVVTESFLVVALLQYSFLVVTVLFSGSKSTRFWWSLTSVGYSTLFWMLWLFFVVVNLLVSDFYSTYFWLVL